MFEHLRKILASHNSEEKQSAAAGNVKRDKKKIQIAACALFIEMAKADGEFSVEERNFIITEMKNVFNPDSESTRELIELAEEHVKESVSIYEFTGLINSEFTQAEKMDLIDSLWRLIYQDEKLNAYEDQLIKRIAATLNLEHKQIINSKLLVKEQMGLK